MTLEIIVNEMPEEIKNPKKYLVIGTVFALQQFWDILLYLANRVLEGYLHKLLSLKNLLNFSGPAWILHIYIMNQYY